MGLLAKRRQAARGASSVLFAEVDAEAVGEVPAARTAARIAVPELEVQPAADLYRTVMYRCGVVDLGFDDPEVSRVLNSESDRVTTNAAETFTKGCAVATVQPVLAVEEDPKLVRREIVGDQSEAV